MEVHWIRTPRGTWLCSAEQYRGIILDLHGGWLAWVEDARTEYSAMVLFHSLAEAQTWVEQKLVQLLEEHGDRL